VGTAPIGGLFRAVTDDDAAAVLATAWDSGVRYFDTAPHYGAGLAERRLGAFLRDTPRSEVVVSTKVGRLLVPGQGTDGDDAYWGGPLDLVRRRDYTRDGVHRSIEDSLARTGLDRFDLVLIHDPDEHWTDAVARAYPALEELREAGAVSAIGVGMNQWEMPLRFIEQSDIDVVLIAGRFTLLDRTAQARLLPACLERDVAVVAGGVFNSGVLADPDTSPYFDYADASASVVDRAREIRERCRSQGVPLAAAALQFPSRHPAVTSTLVGARDRAEMEENLVGLRHAVPEGLWAELDDLAAFR
jgi:D-threo-aldose 1-dehydrogenase